VEAVMAGKPVLFGPHMENFAPIVGRWLAAGAAMEVKDASELRTQTAILLRDGERRAELSKRAREIASVHEGATRRTARVVMGADGMTKSE
jgi:3-deoxy-D-manno-octulosonic-acid transferase